GNLVLRVPGSPPRLFQPRLVVLRRSFEWIRAGKVHCADTAGAFRPVRSRGCPLAGSATAAVEIDAHAAKLAYCVVLVVRRIGPPLPVLMEIGGGEDSRLCGRGNRQRQSDDERGYRTARHA